MSLNTYGFADDIYMESKSFEVSVSAKDKIIKVMDGNVLLASLSMTLEKNILSLIGKDDMVVAEVNLPKSEVISNAYYDKENKQIVIVVEMSDGTISELTIDVSDLIMIYEGHNGIEVIDNKIGIKINEESYKYLSVDDDGLQFKVDSLDDTYVTDEYLKNYATKEDISDMATISWVNSQNYATKEDISDMATTSWVNSQNYATKEDISTLATSESVENLEKKVDNKVDWTDISTPENLGRKAIVLNNHDTLLGSTTSGGTVNIAMVSKWDKVDLGSAQLPINLNGNAERPTYNDDKELALMIDLSNISVDVNKELDALKESDVEIKNSINDLIKSDDLLSNDINLLKNNYEELNNNLNNEISNRELEDSNLNERLNNEVTTRINEDDMIKSTLKSKVDWTDISTEENPNRKAIVLNNHDTILGADPEGNTRSVLMVNKWGIVDLGTTTLPINLNTPSGVRPTVQEAGQSGEEANKIAYLSDILNIEDKIDKIDSDTQDALSNKVDWTNVSTPENPNRKSIVLNNHDTLLGSTTSGGTVNIAMVSKWDKVDLGSAQLPINLNGNAERPTYNDDKELALIDDIINSNSTIKLVKKSELQYVLMVNNNEAGEIIIPKDKYLKSVEYLSADKSMRFVLETADGERTTNIDLSELYNIYLGKNGIELTDNIFSIKLDNTDVNNQYLALTENGLKVIGIDEKFSQYSTSNEIKEIYVTKEELNNETNNLNTKITDETSRAIEAESLLNTNINNVIGSVDDDDNTLTLYGIQKLASKNDSKVINIENEISVINSKFDDYVTIESAVTMHNSLKNECNNYCDTAIENSINGAIIDSVNKSKEYTDTAIKPLSETIVSNTNRIIDLESRCNHFDDLFAMILDEHGSPIELNFYTKTESDNRYAQKDELANKVDWVSVSDDNVQIDNNVNPIDLIAQINELKNRIKSLEDTISEINKKDA